MRRRRRSGQMTREVLQLGSLRLRVRTLTGTGTAANTGRRMFVLVHGIGVSSTYFEPLAHQLHTAGDVLLIDLPGFGGLPQPSKPLSIRAFAHTVHAAVTTHIGPDRSFDDVVLVGHSMGGQVITELAARTKTTSPTVLIGPPVNASEPTLALQALRFAQSSTKETKRTRLIALRSYTQCGPAWILEVLPSMLRYPILDRIKHVRAPLLLLGGEFDRVAPKLWLDALADAAPDAQVRTVPGAAHAVVDRADFTARAILDHVAAHGQ